jgi:DNA-binding LacI/PurR family transcriptional regulator
MFRVEVSEDGQKLGAFPGAVRYNWIMSVSPANGRARTLEEVAAVAGVSKSTVSRVINGSPGVSRRAADSVRGAIARTGYVPNQAARTLVTRRAGSIALVVSEAEGRVFSDPFFASMVRGANAVLREKNMHLVLMLAEDDRSRRQVLEYLRNGHVDGGLLISTHERDPLPRLLTEEGLPAVLSARPAEAVPISYVDVDSVAGAGLAVDHLAARGCRAVATIAGPQDMPAGQDRLAGYRAALRRHGLPARSGLIAYGNFDRLSGARAAEALLARGEAFDGLFVASDLMALGALAVLAERGLRVPADVAVVGFDDSVAAQEARPPLTTIRQPVEEMGRALTLTLLERIADPAAAVTARIFRPELVVRDSA